MIEENDWRLQGQIRYLSGVKLVKKKYRPYSPRWDHDHCNFCTKKLMLPTDVGYCTPDEKLWICEACFEDFKEMFKWKAIEENLD